MVFLLRGPDLNAPFALFALLPYLFMSQLSFLRVAVPKNVCYALRAIAHFLPLPLFRLPASATGGGRLKTSYSPVVGLKNPKDSCFNVPKAIKRLRTKVHSFFSIAGAGFEPTTFGL